MKKISTLLLVIVVSLTSAFAQLPDGSIAPNFTGTDLNGKVWNLYDILDQGKSVIMDVSATWCGPCWSYHNSHAMRDLYLAHGPDGDDKVMVFYVEGDVKTNTNCLYGTTGCVGGTQGNWVAGTPYPIIDDHTIGDAYEVVYFPTIYLICPDRIVTEIGQKNANQLWAGAQNCGVKFGNNNARVMDVKSGTALSEICEPIVINPSAKLMNLGDADLTSATIELKWNGTVIKTLNWTGSLKTYQTADVVFQDVQIPNAGKLEIFAKDVNGVADEDVTNNNQIMTFEDAPEFTTQQIYVRILTDGYGAELYWEFKDNAGKVLDRGGNLAVGPNGGGQYPSNPPTHPLSYKNNTVIRDTLTMPATGCYTFLAVDSYGDGLEGQNPNITTDDGYIRLYNLGNTTMPLIQYEGNFGASKLRGFGGEQFVGVQDVLPAREIDIFPNPATAEVNVEFVLMSAANVQLNVLNSLGQVVISQASKSYPNGIQMEKIGTQQLPNGIYLLQFNTDAGSVVKKFSVQH